VGVQLLALLFSRSCAPVIEVSTSVSIGAAQEGAAHATADDVVETGLVGRCDKAAGIGHAASLAGRWMLENGKSPRRGVGFLP